MSCPIFVGLVSRRGFVENDRTRTAGQTTNSCCTRRVWLGAQELGGLAGLYANVEHAFAATPTKPQRSKSVILIFNGGAPSHIDLFDPKPDAPEATRGKYQTIDTNVAGIQFSETLPKMAQRADKLALIRSVHHQHSGHNSGMYWSIVGRPYPVDSTLITPSRTDLPSFGR